MITASLRCRFGLTSLANFQSNVACDLSTLNVSMIEPTITPTGVEMSVSRWRRIVRIFDRNTRMLRLVFVGISIDVPSYARRWKVLALWMVQPHQWERPRMIFTSRY